MTRPHLWCFGRTAPHWWSFKVNTVLTVQPSVSKSPMWPRPDSRAFCSEVADVATKSNGIQCHLIPHPFVTLYVSATQQIICYVIRKPRVTFQGAATSQIQCHVIPATCYIAGCCERDGWTDRDCAWQHKLTCLGCCFARQKPDLCLQGWGDSKITCLHRKIYN